MAENYLDFPINIYGKLDRFSDTISKGRCRIFYKYANRNGSYITDEFAEKLLASLPYTPVKGIFDEVTEDYTDHGQSRDLGRIYGIVPAEPNIKWEEHEDIDGTIRTYATCDVLLFTALYSEAEIMDKSESMEIYAPSIKGDWKVIENKKYFVFEEGCFLGLQILGDDVEPCFEGAGFFSLIDQFRSVVRDIEEYAKKAEKLTQGDETMPNINFKLSDSQKHDAIWSLLNPNFSEEGNWMCNTVVCDVYDEYAVCYDYEEGCYYRAYYTKNDETDSLEINQKKKCYILDVSEEEKMALDALHSMNGENFEKVDEKFSSIDNLKEENSNYQVKIDELNETISTLNTEKSEISENYAKAQELATSLNEAVNAAQEKVSTLETSLSELQTYKASVEKSQKMAVIDNYKEHLSTAEIEEFTNDETLDKYTVDALDRELAYKLVKSNPSVFSKASQPYILKDVEKDGISKILSQYKKD